MYWCNNRPVGRTNPAILFRSEVVANWFTATYTGNQQTNAPKPAKWYRNFANSSVFWCFVPLFFCCPLGRNLLSIDKSSIGSSCSRSGNAKNYVVFELHCIDLPSVFYKKQHVPPLSGLLSFCFMISTEVIFSSITLWFSGVLSILDAVKRESAYCAVLPLIYVKLKTWGPSSERCSLTPASFSVASARFGLHNSSAWFISVVHRAHFMYDLSKNLVQTTERPSLFLWLPSSILHSIILSKMLLTVHTIRVS